jgi:hypothetical protein
LNERATDRVYLPRWAAWLPSVTSSDVVYGEQICHYDPA